MSDEVAEVAFEAAGETCSAWLHLPARAAPHPCVVMLHSTGGLRQLLCYAERGRAFARSGIAALQFDCRGFGASAGLPRQLFDVRRRREDLDAAVAFARARPDLDADSIGLWAGSAGCGPALARASEDAAIRAVVCLTPFVPGRATQRSARTPLLRLAAAACADRLRPLVGLRPRGVAIAGEPGETAILVREDAVAGERSLLPAEARLDPSGNSAELPGGVAWENRVVLRPRLRTPHPLRLAPRVAAPLLVVAGERDLLCPPGPAAAVAERAPRGELRRFPYGHFELYRGASIAAETEFLARALGGASSR